MLSLLLASSVAWPCAGLFTSSSEVASSDAQEAIFRLADGNTEVEYNIRYVGEADDLGWIIPIPGEFVALEEADSALFDEYRSLTAPFYTDFGDSVEEGCGCAGGDKAGGANDLRADDGFSVELASGFAGSYEYTVLNGNNVAAVLSWLDDNGWRTDGQSEALNIYALYDMDFVAIKLVPDAVATGTEGRGLQPFRVIYEGEIMSFPALMSYYGMLDSYRTTVWIEGAGRASVEEGGFWSQVEFGTRAVSNPDLEPVDEFDATLFDLAGASPVYALTWAGETASGGFLTRLDTNVARETSEEDVVFVLGTNTDPSHAELTVGEAVDTAAAAAFLGALPLLGVGWARRRRR